MQSQFTQEQIARLNQPVDPKRLKHRQGGGGVQLAYLKGHDVINIANEIFGFGNWGYDLLGVELIEVPEAGAFYAARVQLQVANCVPITEEGCCAIQEGRNPRAKIDAYDMARKGAITDALKRCLRCFGDQFGNSLYDNDLVDGQPREQSANSTSDRAQNKSYNSSQSRSNAPQSAPRRENNVSYINTRPSANKDAGELGTKSSAVAEEKKTIAATVLAQKVNSLQDTVLAFRDKMADATAVRDRKALDALKQRATDELAAYPKTLEIVLKIYEKATKDPDGFVDTVRAQQAQAVS